MRIFSQGNPFATPEPPDSAKTKPIVGLELPKGILAPPVAQSPLAALAALEQWRVKEEDTHRQQARWSLSQCPLHVWIEPYPLLAPSGQPTEVSGAESQIASQALFAAMRQWEVATEGAIRFTLLPMSPGVSAGAEADIIVNWETQTTLGRDYEVGHTNRRVQGKRIVQATITLITQPLIDAHLTPLQRRQRLYTTVLHETGHALGLEHSEQPEDVMYYRGWQRPFLSENDISRVRDLYKH